MGAEMIRFNPNRSCLIQAIVTARFGVASRPCSFVRQGLEMALRSQSMPAPITAAVRLRAAQVAGIRRQVFTTRPGGECGSIPPGRHQSQKPSMAINERAQRLWDEVKLGRGEVM